MTPVPESPAPIPSPPQPAHVELKALLLLILMGALVCGFVLYVMYARGVFESTQRLVLISDDSEGVLVGMDLTFSGFPIGRVQRIDLGADGKARILIDVPRKDANWLRTSSVFTLERGLVGDTRIRAFTGVLDDPLLPPDSERTVLRGDTAAEIPRLVATARELLENLQTITAADSSLNTSLANVQTLTGRLNGQYGVLGGALGGDENAKKIVATLDRVNTLLAKADQRVFGQPGGKAGVMDDAQAAIIQLNGMLSDARASLKKVDAVLAEAQAVGSNARIASNDLGALRAEVDASLRKVTQLVDEINRKWPFARDTELKLP
ncbi:mammalian cell entry protein [Collimonas pratensis]|uniref:MlaD family protein n=1 Tax=Collimonas pratensis TaxID=279113 RepID=UPI00143D6659|nr:MlaD family protein [Collimonas pratensis]NKI69486.1 mammalian cell entry protein [Collimonas pratensis]